MTAFNAPMFQDEDKAREALEALRWPDGPYCPHCGNSNQDKIAKVEGKKQSHRPGLFYCNGCKGQFTVTVGTVFERSKVPLTKWWLAAHLLNSSKKGMSAHQIHRTIGVTYKTAWFMMHRLREAMRELNPTEPMGGKVRSHHAPSVTAKTLRPILQAQIDAATYVMSDDGGARLSKEFEKHATINHSIGEYVRGDAHTNTIEGYFSILKRGINGIYHHVSQQHLKRYLAEFDFRYNERAALNVDDFTRTMKALLGAKGKRLTYKGTNVTPQP